MSIPMQVSMGILPVSCYPSEQARANGFAGSLQVLFPDSATVMNFGNATPSVDQQDFPWIRINSDGTPDKTYVFYNGFWCASNPTPANSPLVLPYLGSLSSIDTYDGGESGTVGVMTGPMWQVDATFSGRFPLSTDAVNYPQGTFGGEANHTLSIAEIPSHTHSGSPVYAPGNTWQGGGNTFGPMIPPYVQESGATGGGAAHNNIPPYFSLYFVKRTGRQLYRL